jgi:hypothetical protein
MAGEGSTVSVIDGGGPPPPPEHLRDATRATARAALQADLARELDGLDGDAPAEAKPAEPAATPEEPAKPAEEAPTEESEDATDPGEEPTEEKPEAKPDKDLDKRLAAIQREEKRAKAAVAAERRAVEEERRAVQAERDRAQAELQAFRKVQERARYDLPGVLRALGYKDEDFEAAAQEVYTASPKGRQDPRLQDRTRSTSREREYEDRLASIERQNQALLQQLEQRDAAQRTAAWIDEAAKAASDETPLVQAMISRAPAKARAMLAKVAEQLLDETGEVPDHADVVLELEKIRRAELEELGIDAPAAATAAPKTKPVTPAAKTKPATTLSSDLRTSAVQQQPRSTPKSYDERRRDDMERLAADFQAGRYDA